MCGNLPVKVLKNEYLCDKQQLKFELLQQNVVRTAPCLMALYGKTKSNGLDNYGDRKKKYSTIQICINCTTKDKALYTLHLLKLK